MTYKEIKRRLSKCEKTLEMFKSKNYKRSSAEERQHGELWQLIGQFQVIALSCYGSAGSPDFAGILGVKGVDLAHATFHVKKDYPLAGCFFCRFSWYCRIIRSD